MANPEIFKNKKLFNKSPRFNPKKRNIVYTKENFNVKIGKHFSGSSPPEIFVGRYNYPNINAGILSPDFFKNTNELAMPEIWHEKKFSIGDILTKRSQLIYGRFKTQIKKPSRFKELMQEIAMAHNSVSTEFFLKKPPKQNLQINKFSPIIANLAPLENAKLQENPKVKRKVDYLVSDTDNKALNSMIELHRSDIPVSNINKILSAGLLGLKTKRKLVPTRWSIVAVDSALSKFLMSKIRTYPLINDYLVFSAEYLGNHYQILLVPRFWSFEVIEAEIKHDSVKVWQDFEGFHDRKNYADEVVGGYYVARLAVAEYLNKIKRQATAFVFREVTPDYYAHLGVGILRECCRDAFKNNPEKFNTLKEALDNIQTKFNLSTNVFIQKSQLFKELEQTTLNKWF